MLHNWLEVSPHHDFSIYNLPFGIFSTAERSPRVGVALGDYIIDLYAATELGFAKTYKFDKAVVFKNKYLNDFMALGNAVTYAIRDDLQKELTDFYSTLRGSQAVVERDAATMHMPVKVGDYTDFYSSRQHAHNVGSMFRDPDNALLPNWRHMPVGYHGRASSIILSGQDIHRPMGQIKPKDSEYPIFGASRRMDFELEMAFVVSQSTELGQRVSTSEAMDHIFGMVIFNDWSARDIQKWEYVPLGPFLGKSFASSISPWVVTMAALDDFRVAGESQEPTVLPYLHFKGDHHYDIALGVDLQIGEQRTTICKSNYKYMYWNMCQQLAHHTVNGCSLAVGDMMASGTISGNTPDSYGSMLELSWAGQRPIELPSGEQRTFLEDGDTVRMYARSSCDDYAVGFGEVVTQLLPAQPFTK